MSDPVVIEEYVPSEPVALTVAERDTLRALVPGLTVQPAFGSTETYTLTASSTVGVVRVGSVTVEIRPKVGVAPVLFLVSYALDPAAWRHNAVPLGADANLAEAVVPLFARTCEAAIGRGLLHGYRSHQDALMTIRGRVRIADQFRRTGAPLPVDVTYDEFTPNVLENRLLRSAVDTLGRLHLRDARSRSALARLHHQLSDVDPHEGVPGDVPEPLWTRLNERYRPAVSLARLVIAMGGVEARAGRVDASAFLVDMNGVFERFVRVAIRERLRLDRRAFPDTLRGRTLYLDDERSLRLVPDLSWWDGERCVFVGDCKYQRPQTSIPNADVYQMLAYTTRLGLSEAVLVYATDATPHDVTLSYAGRKVRVTTVDVAREPSDVLAQVATVADSIAAIAAPARPSRVS